MSKSLISEQTIMALVLLSAQLPQSAQDSSVIPSPQSTMISENSPSHPPVTATHVILALLS